MAHYCRYSPTAWLVTRKISPPKLPTHFRSHGTHFFPGAWQEVIDLIGRGEWIRTTDLLVPNQAL